MEQILMNQLLKDKVLVRLLIECSHPNCHSKEFTHTVYQKVYEKFEDFYEDLIKKGWTCTTDFFINCPEHSK